MDCYKSLIKQITRDPQKINEIKGIRNSKKKGRYDPITVKQTYRLIGVPELEEVLDTSWQNYCGSQLAKTNDLKGIRFIDEALIIIEIDEFNRHTLTEKYSREKTKEFHRLIISSKRVENGNFYFGEEYLLQRDTLENNWIYEVTQMKMIH